MPPPTTRGVRRRCSRAEDGLAVVERLEQSVAGDHRADGRVARGQTLGAGDDVRDVAKSSHANIDPIRPYAQITSSDTSSTSYSSQISRTRSKYPGGGGKHPAFCTGSRNTAATVSGPSNSMASAMRSAQ